MKVKDIIAAIEAFAPACAQAEGDNSGLQLGSPEQEVHGVLIALDCTPALIEEAASRGCDMILTHHPLLYHPLQTVDPEEFVGGSIYAAVKHGCAIYAAHTSADRVKGGVSWVLAGKLGLKNVQTLDPDADGLGFGAVGDLPEPKSPAEALELVKEALGLHALRHSAPVEGPVSRVAVCGGSGTSLVGKALTAGAQLFVCGDITYHHFFAPQGIMLADAGHFETEVGIVDIFCSVLKKNFPNFAVLISQDIKSANPVRYSI